MYFIGVDVGGMSLKAGVVDENGNIIGKKSVKTTPNRKGDLIVDDLAQLIKDVAKECKLELSDVAGVGMGFPGSIWDEKGEVRYCCNIDLVRQPVVKILHAKGIDCPIHISNDANCAVLGEKYFGAAKGAKDVVLITLGTGVGTGIIVNGELLTGNRSAGAEGGHMTINLSGPKCGCGHKGHFESYASATGLIREAKAAVEKHPESTLKQAFEKEGYEGFVVFRCANEGDKTANAVVAKYIKYLGTGVVNLCNLFYPEYVIVGGGISNNSEFFLPQLQRFVSRNVYGSKYNPKIKVLRAALVNDAGIIGAASLCISKIK